MSNYEIWTKNEALSCRPLLVGRSQSLARKTDRAWITAVRPGYILSACPSPFQDNSFAYEPWTFYLISISHFTDTESAIAYRWYQSVSYLPDTCSDLTTIGSNAFVHGARVNKDLLGCWFIELSHSPLLKAVMAVMKCTMLLVRVGTCDCLWVLAHWVCESRQSFSHPRSWLKL